LEISNALITNNVEDFNQTIAPMITMMAIVTTTKETQTDSILEEGAIPSTTP